MNYPRTIILLTLAIISLNSCTSPTNIVSQGDITGTVLLRKLNGQIDQINNIVSVSLTGKQTYSTVSADSGKFTLSNVNQGIYSINYSKMGYTSFSQENIQFVGNGTLKLETVWLSEIDTLSNIKDSSKYDKRCYGYVQLFDENGDSLKDNSGVLVSIKGTNYTAISDNMGVFYFDKYPAESQTVVFSKSGFDDLTIPDVYFPEISLVKIKSQLHFQKYRVVELAKKPNLDFKIEFVTCGDYFSIETAQDGWKDSTILFGSSYVVLPSGYGKRVWSFMIIGDDENISMDKYFVENKFQIDILSNPGKNYSPVRKLTTGRFDGATRWHIDHAGRKFYYKLYAIWARGNGSEPQFFSDSKTKRRIYSGWNASEVMSSTFPTTYK